VDTLVVLREIRVRRGAGLETQRIHGLLLVCRWMLETCLFIDVCVDCCTCVCCCVARYLRLIAVICVLRQTHPKLYVSRIHFQCLWWQILWFRLPYRFHLSESISLKRWHLISSINPLLFPYQHILWLPLRCITGSCCHFLLRNLFEYFVCLMIRGEHGGCLVFMVVVVIWVRDYASVSCTDKFLKFEIFWGLCFLRVLMFDFLDLVGDALGDVVVKSRICIIIL
jgi:hypothetical protein